MSDAKKKYLIVISTGTNDPLTTELAGLTGFALMKNG